MKKSSKKCQQRFEQIRQQKVKNIFLFIQEKITLFLIENSLSTIEIKNKSVRFYFNEKYFIYIDGEQSNCTTYFHDNDQHHYPIATTSGSVRSTTSSSSSIQQTNLYEHGKYIYRS